MTAADPEQRADHSRAFAIASDLLADDGAAGWSNLGCWPVAASAAAVSYPQACRELALRVGQAAGLGVNDAVIDLGCGQGASLALWPQAFAVTRVTGVERQPDCVAAIRARAPALPALQAIHAGRFDRLPLPAGLPAHGFDAALCVDAAYHAESLAAFAGCAAATLKPGGRLAFTTLVLSAAGERLPVWSRRRLLALLALAGIPAASIGSAAGMQGTLTAAGFAGVRLTALDAEVLAGFAAFVTGRREQLSWRQRLLPGWRKISLTARLCRYLQVSGVLHYSLVQATYTGCSSPTKTA